MSRVSLWKYKKHNTDASVYSEAVSLVARANANRQAEFCEDAAAWQNLNADLSSLIPYWYSALMAFVPLAGLILEWRLSDYQIDHETDEDADEILAAGRQRIAPSLSGFFRTAQVKAASFYD